MSPSISSIRGAIALSVLALGGSGYTAWKTGVFCCSSGGCGAGACDGAEPDEIAVLTARVHALEEQLATANRTPTLLASSKPATTAGDAAGLATAPKSPSSATGPTASAEVIAALEKRLASLEEAEQRRPGILAFESGDSGPGPQIAFSSPKMYGSVADAAKDLDLSPRQKDDFERAVADARKEMDELKKIPDSDGKTWEDIEKDAMPKAGEGLGTIDLGALMGYPSRKIPGRTETFGQAQKRIQDGAKSRMRDTLTPDQQKKFAKAHADPMLGGSSGAVFSFSMGTDLTDDAAMK